MGLKWPSQSFRSFTSRSVHEMRISLLHLDMKCIVGSDEKILLKPECIILILQGFQLLRHLTWAFLCSTSFIMTRLGNYRNLHSFIFATHLYRNTADSILKESAFESWPAKAEKDRLSQWCQHWEAELHWVFFFTILCRRKEAFLCNPHFSFLCSLLSSLSFPPHKHPCCETAPTLSK